MCLLVRVCIFACLYLGVCMATYLSACLSIGLCQVILVMLIRMMSMLSIILMLDNILLDYSASAFAAAAHQPG